jgi:hypothetical protein
MQVMSSYKYIDVEVCLDEWRDDELIEELNDRGYNVDKGDYNVIIDDIFALYKEWLDDKGDRDNRFEKAMRAFFEKHLNKVSV